MDENKRRINGVLPEDDFLWLADVANRKDWTLSRTLRWAVGEARKRQYDLAEAEHLRELEAEIAMAGDPPPDPNPPKSAAEAFPEWTDEEAR